MQKKPLRRAVMLGDEYWALCPWCGWDANDTYFDRSICPHPCGSMHTCCAHCGAPDDYCYWENPSG